MSKSNGFDLCANNYTIKELEHIFGLSSGSDYDVSAVEMCEQKLKQDILTNQDIAEALKKDVFKFMNDIKDRLIQTLTKNGRDPLEGFKKIQNTFHSIYNIDKSLQDSELVETGTNKNIIKQPVTPYAQSMPSEFFQGVINPLAKRILRQNINIDTRFRENYYNSKATNFHFDLPLRLTKVVSLQLSAFELPNTFYVVSKVLGNNFFVIELAGSGGSGTIEPLVVTIPDGNYEYLALQNYINHYLSVVAPVEYQTIQCLVDINTDSLTTTLTGPSGGSGKMIFGSSAGDLAFSLNFLTDSYGNEERQTPLPLKLGWLMGYREGYYFNSFTYVSEGVVNLLGPRYIYLVVDDFNNNVSDGFYSAFTSSILNKNILARISLQGSVFNNLSKDNMNLITTPRQYFGPVDIKKLQIQLLDEYGRIFDLNNMDYSFCLTFQTVYDI